MFGSYGRRQSFLKRGRGGKRALIEYVLRFATGGIAVSAFAALGDALRPKSFAGLFGAAPSIALVTLLMAVVEKGSPFAILEARSMMVGALGLAAYSWTVCLLLKKFSLSALPASLVALALWFVVSFGLLAGIFGLTE
jgi:Protein of unknown function (DUF3147)